MRVAFYPRPQQIIRSRWHWGPSTWNKRFCHKRL